MFAVTANGEQAGDAPTWKAFDEIGKSFWQELKTDTSQTMKVQGQEVTQTQKQTFWVKWTPKKKEANGWEVEYEIVGVKMDIEIGGNRISYDSFAKEPPPQNPLTDFFKQLLNSKFTLKVANDPKEGIKVVDVTEGLDAFVNKLAAANDQLKPLLKSILNKEAFKQMSNPTFAAFPKNAEEFKKGQWKYDSKLDMGPIGIYDTHYTYNLAADGKKVEVTGTMEYSAPAAANQGGLPFIIKKGKLDAEKISGNVMLDPKGGRIESSTIQMDLKGDLTIDIAGMETNVNLTQKQISSVKTLDTDPVPQAKAK